MEWVALAVLAAAVVAVAVLVVTGRIEPSLLEEPTSSVPPLELPDEPRSDDVDRLRLGTSVYGYAAPDVDAALDARRERLAEQERELAERVARADGEPRDETDGVDGVGHVRPHA